MFCNNCGNELLPGDRFCPSCGCANSGYREEVEHVQEQMPQNNSERRFRTKESVYAVLLSMIFPGLGHLYMRKKFAAVSIMIISVSCTLISYTLFPPTLLISCIVWLLAVGDVKNCVEEYNKCLKENGVPPW